MHYSLDPRNVSRLRAPTQGLATAAAHGSLKELRKLHDLIPQLGPDSALFLPVLFANLNASGVPEAAALDNLLISGSPMHRIECAAVSLTAICDLIERRLVPPEAYRDLWPQIWAWVHFFHSYWDFLPLSDSARKIDHFIDHTTIVLSFFTHDPLQDTIRSTPGVRRVCAMVWRAIVDSDSICTDHGALSHITKFLCLFVEDEGNGTNFQEILDGVGGTVEDLASTMMKHLSRGSSNLHSDSTNHFLCMCMYFVEKSCANCIGLDVALGSASVVPALVKTLIALDGTAHVEALKLCFIHLQNLIDIPSAPRHIAQALEAGLLRLILMMARKLTANECALDNKHISSVLLDLLEEVLPRSLVHYRVLVQLRKSFPEIRKSATTLRSPFDELWQSFLVLAKTRLDFLDSWESQSRIALKACDNMHCGKIDTKRSFKRCSACHSVLYCSKDCQTIDWEDAHGTECGQLQLLHLPYPETLRNQEKSFLRALLTHDYLRLMPEACIRQAVFMHQHPGQPFVTMYNYATSVGGVEIGVQDTSACDEDPDLAAWVSIQRVRAARSGRRMDLHLMSLYDGQQVRHVLFSMRSATSQTQDALLRAVGLVPRGTSVEEAALRIEQYLGPLVAKFRREAILIY
ncbi:hypothetical protein B0H11DRAFT_757731 [Mycena galericulata]|nr:hypothetical protein B0H11DRAFT_757731 [Mycena galericulata]